MSIYTTRYQGYDGPREAPSTRFLAIAENELRRFLQEKWAKRLVLLAWTPVIFLAGWLYLALILKKVSGVEGPSLLVYDYLFRSELFFIAVMLAAFGAGVIVRDIDSKALTLYFTRPIDAGQYHLGKLIATGALVLVVTMVPGLLLAVAQHAMAEEFRPLELLDGLWRIAVCSFGIAFTGGNLILLLSSTGWSSRYVGAAWLGAFTLAEVIRGVLVTGLGSQPMLDLISLGRLFTGSVEYLFAGRSDQLPALVSLYALGVFFFVWLRFRIIALERGKS